MNKLIEQYLDGPRQLREAIAGMTGDQMNAHLFPASDLQDRSFATLPTSSRFMPTE
jgi:hypothetical protein